MPTEGAGDSGETRAGEHGTRGHGEAGVEVETNASLDRDAGLHEEITGNRDVGVEEVGAAGDVERVGEAHGGVEHQAASEERGVGQLH